MTREWMDNMVFDNTPSKERVDHERRVAEDKTNSAAERVELMEEMLQLNPFMEDWEFDNLTNSQMRRRLSCAEED